MGIEGTVTPVEGTASAKAREFNETWSMWENAWHVAEHWWRAGVSITAMNPLSFLNLAFFLLLEDEMPCGFKGLLDLFHISELIYQNPCSIIIPPILQVGKLRLPRSHSP